jgi:hypothetical protein
MEQIVQVPGEFDILPGASSSAGHKDHNVNWERTAYRERIGSSRSGGGTEQGSQHHYDYQHRKLE